MKGHAAVWGPDAPTPAQLSEFFAQVKSGRITQQRLQPFLTNQPEPNNVHVSGAYDVPVWWGPDAIKYHLDKKIFPQQRDYFQVSDATFPQGQHRCTRNIPVRFVYFGRHIGNAEAQREFKRLGYRAAKPNVLLSAAKCYPYMMLCYGRVVALGQFYEGKYEDSREQKTQPLAVCVSRDGNVLEAWAFPEDIWKNHDTEVRFAVVPQEIVH